jgi:hypothetical protein
VNWVQRLRVQENLKVFQLKVLVELAYSQWLITLWAPQQL